MSSEHELIDFAVDFVQEARKNPPKHVKSEFSVRQAKTIAQMGTALILENSARLGVDDLVTLAVRSTPPEDQGYAHTIALRVLLGDERSAFTEGTGEGVIVPDVLTAHLQNTPSSTQTPLQQLQEERLRLRDVLEALRLSQSVDPQRGRQELQAMHEFIRDAEEELFRQPVPDNSPETLLDRARKRLAFEIAGGQKGIQDLGVQDWDQMLDLAERKTLQTIPTGDPARLAETQLLGASDRVSGLALDPFMKQLAEVLQETAVPPEAAAQDCFEGMSSSKLSKTLDALEEYDSLLERMGIAEEDYAPALDQLRSQLSDKVRTRASCLDDILRNPGAFRDQADREDISRALRGSQRFEPPLSQLKKAHAVDELLGTDLADAVYSSDPDMFSTIPPSDLVSDPVMCTEWLEALKGAFEQQREAGWHERSQLVEKMEDIRSRQSTPSFVSETLQDLIQAQCANMIQQSQSLDTLSSVAEMAQRSDIAEKLQDDFGDWINDVVPRSHSIKDLTSTVETAKKHSWPFSVDKVRQKGRELGMSSKDISALIGDVFEYIKHLIQSEDPSFERLDPLMQDLDLTEDMFDELLQDALENDSAGGLASLAQKDLKRTAGQIPDDKMPLFNKALGAGPGENLLMQWFESGDELQGEMREMVKDTLKRVTIELGKKKASALLGSSEVGPIPDGTYVPFMMGDDPDTIDLDETMMNLLALGKKPEQATIEDFIAKKTVSGRRCVTFLIDVSGSMSGAPLAASVLAASMMIHAFARDELALAIFESDTHVLCEVGSPVDTDALMDTVLDLRAMGGTQMQRALQWAESQFYNARSNDRMLVMITDAMIGDLFSSQVHLKNMEGMRVTSVLAVPEDTHSLGNIQAMLESSGASLVPIGDWSEFPELVSKILSRS